MKTASALQKDAMPDSAGSRSGDVQLGKRLTALRESFNLTQTDVSRAVPGVSRTLLASIEMGWTMPTLRAAVMLAAFYEVTLDDLTAHLRPA